MSNVKVRRRKKKKLINKCINKIKENKNGIYPSSTTGKTVMVFYGGVEMSLLEPIETSDALGVSVSHRLYF